MLLPYQTLMLESALTPTQALERLMTAVEPRRRFRLRRGERPFEGSVEDTSFHMQRIIGYRNSFLPQLHGRIEPSPIGRARVLVAFRLHPAVAVFMGIWFGFSALFGATAVGQPSSSPGDLDPRLLVGGMLAFGVVLLFGAFIPEAQKAARLLEGIFSARVASGGAAAA